MLTEKTVSVNHKLNSFREYAIMKQIKIDKILIESRNIQYDKD
jgi:hypothetical protein